VSRETEAGVASGCSRSSKTYNGAPNRNRNERDPIVTSAQPSLTRSEPCRASRSPGAAKTGAPVPSVRTGTLLSPFTPVTVTTDGAESHPCAASATRSERAPITAVLVWIRPWRLPAP
jgi:hypothetical protein